MSADLLATDTVEPVTVAIVGTGGLAGAVCYSLAASSRPVRVLVLGRNAQRLAEICYIANARALGGPATFRSARVSLDDDGALADVLGKLRPTGVLVAASLQSPWESRSTPSAWTALIRRVGFGITLPFQAAVALRVGRILAAVHPDAWLINGCFPDAVNPVLARLNVPVLCGIGNVNLLSASLHAAIRLSEGRSLKMLAHHLHLQAPPSGAEEAMAWVDDQPVTNVGEMLAAQRAAARPELNHVTGHLTAGLVGRLLTDERVETSLPGPLGLPGGYPVCLEPHVSGIRIRLNLPPGLSIEHAVAFNQRAAERDGVLVDSGRVIFTRVGRGDLPGWLAHGFDVTELAQVTEDLADLRGRLRSAAEH